MRLWLLLFTVLFWFWSCKNKEGVRPQPGAEPVLWAEYKVWGDEGDSMATCLLQFYADPQKRQAIRMKAPAKVMVDGTEVEGDSAGFSGVFYEYRLPLSQFSGRHVISLVNKDQVFADSFFFYSFGLLSSLPQAVPAQSLYLQLEGLPDGSPVRVVLTDTSLAGLEYNELMNVTNSKLVIQTTHLAKLKKGPVVLFLSAEEGRPLSSGLQGRISVSYNITRSFMLVN